MLPQHLTMSRLGLWLRGALYMTLAAFPPWLLFLGPLADAQDPPKVTVWKWAYVTVNSLYQAFLTLRAFVDKSPAQTTDSGTATQTTTSAMTVTHSETTTDPAPAPTPTPETEGETA